MILLGVIGLVVGLMVIESSTSDLRASLEVSRSAVRTIGDTVDIAAELAEGTTDAMRSASRAAASAGAATRNAAEGIDGVASFLRQDLPEDIDAIRRALPGAIGAADAIDSTLGALSFVGLDYSPEEPFGESLRRIQSALDELPAEVRAQSEALALLAPAAEEVAGDVEDLAADHHRPVAADAPILRRCPPFDHRSSFGHLKKTIVWQVLLWITGALAVGGARPPGASV
jgi:methyl-accepting chemotaxis protein